MAYSFTQDGYWEMAKYRVTPNRKSEFSIPLAVETLH